MWSVLALNHTLANDRLQALGHLSSRTLLIPAETTLIRVLISCPLNTDPDIEPVNGKCVVVSRYVGALNAILVNPRLRYDSCIGRVAFRVSHASVSSNRTSKPDPRVVRHFTLSIKGSLRTSLA